MNKNLLWLALAAVVAGAIYAFRKPAIRWTGKVYRVGSRILNEVTGDSPAMVA